MHLTDRHSQTVKHRHRQVAYLEFKEGKQKVCSLKPFC